ncbi:hypothetical protein [Paenibacillus sp. NPDC058177]|uniref:hypothetical protein n=1 Tax=Paenibacillus sp. NPDC058177 TaxID=3346369 RepID=UPI0036DEAAE9
MLKKTKIFTGLFVLFLATSAQSAVYADTQSPSEQEMKYAIQTSYQFSTNFVNDLTQNDLIYYYNNISELQDVSYKDNYYKIEYVPVNDLNRTFITDPSSYKKVVTEVSKEEAEIAAALQNSPIKPHGTTPVITSWLKLETTVEKYSSTEGGVSGRFEWLTSPFFRGKDALAVGLNANSSSIPGTSSAVYKYMFYTDSGTLVSDEVNYSKPDTDVAAGISYFMNLTKTSNSVYNAGYMKYRFKPNVSNLTVADAYSMYAHNESTLTINPSVSFPGGGSVSISPATKYDKVTGHAIINW